MGLKGPQIKEQYVLTKEFLKSSSVNQWKLVHSLLPTKKFFHSFEGY